MSAVTGSARGRVGRVGKWATNPWAKARFLWLVALGYMGWTLLPVAIAIAFSFNAGKSQTAWQGFSLTRWYVTDVSSVWQDETLRSALLQSVRLSGITVLIAVPFGVAFGLALDRWRTRTAKGANLLMMFSFVTPEIAIGVALFLYFTELFTAVGLGFKAQVFGLSMFEMAYPVIIVQARLLSIGREYEEAAQDLGASRVETLRRVLLPLLSPAIVASAAIVFATSIDNFVLSQRLSIGASTQTVPILIYASARTSPLPSLNALATITLVMSTGLIAVALLVFRRTSREERRKAAETRGLGLPV